VSGQVTLEVLVGPEERRAALCQDVARGLTSSPKALPPVWFYDETGSRLFEAITELPEYHLTRAERQILEERAGEIAEISQAEVLVELGSGTSEKTRLLLDALAGSGTLRRIVLLDISAEVLAEAARTLADHYQVAVHGVVGDFRRHLGALRSPGRQLVCFLGSTIGNLLPQERAGFLARLAGQLGREDHFLLGTDLCRDPARLALAYDDPAGLTAAFNLNLLGVLNRELRAGFDPARFAHRVRWCAEPGWVEMLLVATEAQRVPIADLELEVIFEAGEALRTEVSTKFRPEQVAQELAQAGLTLQRSFADPAGDFQLALVAPRLP
jgi:L-histidine N-alpha-methyltransferase